MSKHRIYRNNRLYDDMDPKSHNVSQICRSYATDPNVSNPNDVWFCCDEQGLMYYTIGNNPTFLVSDKVDCGMTIDRHLKFFQKYLGGQIQILAQVNPLGSWHGYVDMFLKQSFASEQEAMRWVEDYRE